MATANEKHGADMAEDILKLYDGQRHLKLVQISPRLWEKIEAAMPGLGEKQISRQHDWAGFDEFKAAWNFPYAYDPHVRCPCGSETLDWRNDDKFLLTSANLGGLTVFHCNQCHGTVRLKFFKTHVAQEFSPGEICDVAGAK